MDAGVRHQVSLEFSQVNVKCAIESKGRGDRRYDLADKSVQVGIGRSFNIQVAAADIIDSFIVDHESTIGMFEGSVGGQDGVVRFNDSGRDLRSGVDSEFQFALLSVIDRQSFHEQGSET
jgi:hypothetical protein